MDKLQLQRSVLLIAAFAAFITPFMGAAVNLALPSVGEDLNANAIQLNWVVSAYMLATAVFMLPFGRLGDIYGRKKIFTGGLVLFTISTFMIGFTQTIGYFLVLRVIQGISSAMIFGTSMAIITSVFPPGERGKAMGINITAVYAGLSSGPFLGGIMTEYLGWRSIFFSLVPLGIISVLLTLTKIKTEWAESKNERLDIYGSVLFALSLVLIISGFSRLPGKQAYLLILPGLVIAVLFVVFEKKTLNPLIDISLLTGNRVFSFSNLAAMIHYSATSAIGFFLSLYLQYIKGLDARSAGLVLMTQPILMAVFSIPAGKLSDRHNPGYIASAGIGITSAGILGLTFIGQTTSIVYIITLLAVNGIGYALFSTPNSNAIMSSVEKKHLGVASGMLGTMRMMGQTISLGIAMMLMALFIGQEKINPDTYPMLLQTVRTGLKIFSILCIPAIFASLARNKKLNNINHDN